MTNDKHIVVVGGGITGLAAANRLTEIAPQVRVTLLEASGRLGGVLETCRVDGFLIEGGADNFITDVPWAVDLCTRIGFDGQLVGTNPACRRAFVVHRGQLCPIPEGFMIMAPRRIGPIISTPILSPLGKLRLACEVFVPRDKGDQDESLASFATRRFGRQAYDRLVQPLVGGIYTGDPEKLSLRATMPRFSEMEREHGSLICAVRRRMKTQRARSGGSGARYSMFVAPRNGMSSLVEAIENRLPSGTVRLNSPVTGIKPDRHAWEVSVDGAAPIQASALIVTAAAAAAGKILSPIAPELSKHLQDVPHASCSIVSLGYRREQIAHPLDGFGFVVPRVEGRRILSGSFSSIKYPGRAADGKVLIRVFIGGAGRPDLADLSQDELTGIAHEELAELLSIREQPEFTHVSRRRNTMPQYYVGHLDRLARMEELLSSHSGLFLAGNAWRGVGIPHCIHSGEQAAERASKFLQL